MVKGDLVIGCPGSYFEGTVWLIAEVIPPGFALAPLADLATMEQIVGDRKYTVESQVLPFTQADMAQIFIDTCKKKDQCLARIMEWFPNKATNNA